MKKLLLIVLCVCGVFSIALAQDADTDSTTASSRNEGNVRFDSRELFPTWDRDGGDADMVGVIGENKDGRDDKGEKNGTEKLALNFLPRVIDILMKFVAPIVVIIFVWTGIRFIYAGSDDEALSKSKNMFQYAAIGLAFIVLSYTIMKIVYFLLKG